jgi:O-acetyl-ADP-ribose deacetylase (regulator of RNase III)
MIEIVRADITTLRVDATGIYGFPKPLAADIAVGAMHDHERAFDRIVACLFDAESEELLRRGRARTSMTNRDTRADESSTKVAARIDV